MARLNPGHALLAPFLLVMLLADCAEGQQEPDDPASAGSSPAEGGQVSGTVLNEDGQPVSDASVMFAESPVAVPDIAALTNDQGRFSLSAPAPGHYVVLVVAEGFAERRVAAEIAGGRQPHIIIELTPESQDK